MPARHLLCDSPADLLGTLRLLWKTWRNPERIAEQVTRPLTLVFPTPIHRAVAKRFLLEAGCPLFNVTLLLPNHLRTLLGDALLPAEERSPLWGREELDFLLRETAALAVAGKGEEEAPLCRALSRNAAPLRAALDELTAAGHSFRSFLAAEERGHSHLAPLRRAWEESESHLAPGLRAVRDRKLLSCAKAAVARPQSLPGTLVLFNCGIRQTADFALLAAALRAWEESAVLTLLAAGQEETLEGPWFDLVEQALPGAASALPEQEAEAPELTSLPAAVPRFHLAPGGESLARLVLRQTVAWLSEGKAASLPVGLVFPQDSPVASRVAQLLREKEIPFHSAFSTPLPLRFEQAILADWIALQRDDLWAEPFLLFWRKVITVRAFAERFGEPPLWGGELGRALADAYSRMPNDHVAVLAAVAGMRKPLPALAKFLRWWESDEGRWPAEAPLRDYLSLLAAQLDLLVGPLGKQIRGFLSRELTRLGGEWRRPVSREAACALLLAFVTRREETRDASEWAPVFLLTPEAARGLPWQRLLLAEVTERQWPRPDAGGQSPLLGDALREQLNARIRRPSPSGEGAAGEESYPPGTAPLLTGLVRAHLERENFAALLEGGSRDLVLCAAASDELDGERELHPSEFFRQAWEKHHGPWHDGLPALLLQAAKDAEVEEAADTSDPALDAVATARRARTDPATAFSEFSFLLRSRPEPNPLKEITARAAEATLKDPATAWFAHALKIDANEMERPQWTEESRWALFQGSLLHRLIESSISRLRPAFAEGVGTRWIPLPDEKAWEASLAAVLEETEAELRRAFVQARRQDHLPRWWASEWRRLATNARHLARKCRAQLPSSFTHIAVEIPLSPPLPEPDSVLPPLLWKGKADLVALDAPTPEAATRAVVIDFKTGNSAADFDPGKTAQGADYFQLIVYAALLRATWPHLRETHALVLHRGAGEPVPPVAVDPSDPAFAPLWTVLREAWIEGKWGQYLALRDRFAPTSTMPIATLDIPASVLAAKWARTEGLNAWERGK